MPRDYAALPPTAVRRRDRAVEDEGWMEAFLRATAFGALATLAEEGQPFVHTNIFAFDRERRAIYFHTARVGRTRANVGGGTRACFSAATMGRLLPADRAFDFSVEYAGVTAFGALSVVADPEEARHALQLLSDKYFPHLRPGHDYAPATDDELARTSVFRLDVEAWSGKRKEEQPDFPGAFAFAGAGQPPVGAAARR